MPAAGRKDSKYVRKVHYSYDWPVGSPHVTTRCGKDVLPRHATTDATKITCKTCRKFLDSQKGR